MTMTKKDKERKNIMHIYAALAAALTMQVIPSIEIQLFGACLFMGVLIGAYIFRARSEAESLCKNHMIYIIRTIWIWSLFFSIGAAIATLWIVRSGDHSIIQTAVNQVMSGIVPSEEGMMDILYSYLRANFSLIATVCTLTIGPGMVYLIYRLSKGLSRAHKGHRIGDVTKWF